MKHENMERKAKIIEENIDFIKPILLEIINDSPDIFESNQDFFFKYLLLTSIRKIIIYLPEDILKQNISEISLANFISKTLETKDLMIVVLSLLIVKIIEKKLPSLTRMLSREGIKIILEKIKQKTHIEKCKLPDILANNQVDNKNIFDPKLAKKLFKGKLNDKEDLDDFMKQLQDWQKDPKLLLDTLKKMKNEETDMKNEDKDDVQVGKEDKVDEEEQKASKIEEMDTEKKEELEEMRENEPEVEEPQKDDVEKQLVDISAPANDEIGTTFPDLKLEESDQKSIEKKSNKLKKRKNKNKDGNGEKKKKKKKQKKKSKYDLKAARKEVSKLAEEILSSLGDKFSKDSSEMQELLKISELLKNNDDEGIDLLSSFFNKNSTMTFYEFSKSELIKHLINYLIKPDLQSPQKDTLESKEIGYKNKAEKISIFLNKFYRNSAIPINNFYKNLKSFVTRMPEIAPFSSTNQQNMGSFVQELKYLSTPLRIKVNYEESLTSIMDIDEFTGYVNKGKVNLEQEILYQIYEDAVNLLDDFCESFKSNPSILFQVERFASLKSVEKYMINKFATKILMSISDDFGKRKRKASSMSKKEILEKNEQENGAFIENEEKDKILTKHYLEKKMMEKVISGDDEDLRKNLEKQFLRKPTKIIAAYFEIIIRDPEDSEQDLTKEVSSDVTILELVNKIKELTDESFSVELNFGLRLRTDFFRFSSGTSIPLPQLDSSIESVVQSIKDDIFALEAELVEEGVSEILKDILIAIKILLEIDSAKNVYLDSCHSKLHQSIILDEFGGSELDKNHSKLSDIYSRIFKEPIRILGRQFPKLVKVLFNSMPSMFDFNSRYYFFKHVAFGPTRAMYFIYQANKPAFKELPGSKIGKLRRKKLKVSREKLMEGAEITFNFSHSLSNLLEFDFDYEEGSGLGPTLEFYSMIADEFKKDDQMWRETDDFSYFPKPVQPSQRSTNENCKIFQKWRILGAICGRSILDQRVFDIRLSTAFWKVVLGYKCTLADLNDINRNLQKILNDLQAISNSYEKVKNRKDDESEEGDEEDLSYNGVEIEDLCLGFTLPGYDEYELVENGAEISVTLDNLQEYIDMVIHFYLVESIFVQVEQFREGFNQFMDIEQLFCFKAEELEQVICGDSLENWTIEYLKEAVNPSHGYGCKSDSFLNFLEVLSEMDQDQKRQFLQFTIGAPRLPLGGLKCLSPPLTVVKKIPSYPDQSPDMLLPSVMTCQNYVKLPNYSNKDIMKAKLFLAMKEGQKSFSLS